ncbi:hypothetical protein F4824DRAFT_444851 [Ustulina deusta]|nr:hypothetical protein F4824DRAFT_444851 [Ustulina deusta]
MSNSPENRGQGGPSQGATSFPPNPRESGGLNGANGAGGGGGVNGDHGGGDTVMGSIESDTEEPGNPFPYRPVNGSRVDNDHTDTEGMETDTKDFAPRFPLPATRHENTPESNIAPQLPATRHENTPASVEDGAAPNGDSLNGVWGQAVSPSSSVSEQEDVGRQLGRVAITDGNSTSEPNRVTNDETSSSTSGTDDSPHSLVSHHSNRSSSPGPQHPPGQGGSTGQARDAGNRENPPPNQSSDANSSSGSRADTQGQSRASGDDSRHQQASRDILSLNRASDWGAETATTALGVSRGSFHSQPHGPSHLDPAFPAYTLLGQVPSTSQSQGPSPPMNPIAPSFIPRPEQPLTAQEFAVPRWQPDAEVTNCPICDVQFGMFLRKHHCRKCGRVVCDRCSPHRITIPHPYIVRPPGDLGPAPQHPYPGVERGIADFGAIGGGERVRLCNPCVPDPNTTPPQARQSSRPIIVDGRSLRARLPSNSLGDYSAGPRPHPYQVSQGYNPARTRSATTGAGQGQTYFTFIPYSPTPGQYPPTNSAYFSQPQLSHRHVSASRLPYPPSTAYSGRTHAPWPSVPGSGLDRPLPRTPMPEPEIPEEDACPVCHRELPSRALTNYEVLRETHINNCIASHSNYGGSRVVAATGLGNHGTPPPRTTRRTRMFPYVATEKDCVNDAECTICLEEFKVGDEMARLECFCRFHRSCIDSWFVNHPGRCPIHQHDSFGY